jgi:hypothetical protein
MAEYDDGAYYEVQLNNKQLVFFFMAALAIAVVVFLCGVMVGRGVRDAAPDSREPQPGEGGDSEARLRPAPRGRRTSSEARAGAVDKSRDDGPGSAESLGQGPATGEIGAKTAAATATRRGLRCLHHSGGGPQDRGCCKIASFSAEEQALPRLSGGGRRSGTPPRAGGAFRDESGGRESSRETAQRREIQALHHPIAGGETSL